MTAERIHYWSDEDGGAFPEVELYPDEAVAAQGIADESGMIVGSHGQTVIDTQDCECVPTGDDCVDKPGTACVTRTSVRVWSFQEYEPEEGSERLAADECKRVWFPKGYVREADRKPDEPWDMRPVPVAPGQVEAGL